jgi:hypothetical protein
MNSTQSTRLIKSNLPDYVQDFRTDTQSASTLSRNKSVERMGGTNMYQRKRHFKRYQSVAMLHIGTGTECTIARYWYPNISTKVLTRDTVVPKLTTFVSLSFARKKAARATALALGSAQRSLVFLASYSAMKSSAIRNTTNILSSIEARP